MAKFSNCKQYKSNFGPSPKNIWVERFGMTKHSQTSHYSRKKKYHDNKLIHQNDFNCFNDYILVNSENIVTSVNRITSEFMEGQMHLFQQICQTYRSS